MSPLKIYGPIRIRSMQTGITKWKEGSFEIVEKDNKISLVVHYNTGGIPRMFQLSHNIKNVVLRPSGTKQSRLMLTLQDNSFLSIDKVPSKEAEEMRLFLDAVHQNRLHAAMKPSQGSGSFGPILGSRAPQKETSRQLSYSDNQASSKRGSLETKDDPFRKVLGNPSRGSIKTVAGSGMAVSRTIPSLTLTSTPLRSGLLENRTEKRKRMLSGSELTEDYPKENDSSSNNKAMTDPSRKYLTSSREKQLSLKQAEENRTSGLLPLQSSSFYGSRAGSKDYSSGGSSLDRSNVSSQTPSAKRSLGFLPQPTPLSVKKLRCNQDYTGWNKPRVPLPSHQQQLQGFSNLGNTCYMNAILQSLFSLQSFANDLLKQSIPWKKIPFNALIRRFANLLIKKDISNSETKKELLKKVKNAISATAERFSGYVQNDAHEFLSQCLDQLKEDMEKLNKTLKTESILGEENSPDASATKVFTCPVITNLEFEVQHSIICKACGETIPKREQFNDLSIDLPRRKKPLPPRSIQDSLDLFFRAEELEYSCEKCGGKCALVRHKFNRLPRVLILHLKRYSFNVALSLNNKIGQQVIIPRYLTLSSHCTENTKPPFTLGWSAHMAISRPLKASQMVNSCITSPSTPSKKFTFKSKSSFTSCLDSDSEDELKRSVALSQRLCDMSGSEQQQEDVEKDSKLCRLEPGKSELENSGFDRMSEEEVLAAVLEISRREASPVHSHDDDDKPTSSPDTGFAEDDIQEMPENPDAMETEKPKTVAEPDPTSFTEITKDCDENKENKTPEGSQGEVDWLQQFDMEREREEQELQQALAQSLQEQEAWEQKEDDDLKRATELSLQEFNNSFLDSLGSDEDSGNEDVFDMEYTEAEAEELKRNAETGNLPHSYRLISVVSHIGSTSSSGHYISDVYDIKKQAWFTYNDLEVSKIQEAAVQSDRDRSGYIFFYMHKEIFDELLETEKNSQALSMEVGKAPRQAS
ncbi:ubiquitin carboxyl-terminal hydrolase 37 isoform X1 [Peromyscus maniculatus bairdii]|uniref:Ubiquitin carboxyl-terminal hydrolase n=1 Tax=Peromyscus maniculatus bairdii TaxID=230844 RepID=A0A6J0CDQ1_PERMB|nr:ubiquitin carboxyl-terminal hydrolase 37 isoform X1 [Peromyscus maniculatus bairdii]XP_015841369.1 ubiquitin carboxyl-terminal hydrolase 37 isoform X1 [Peromyscus maniculatus bairdii]XP_042116034.1 ubiquitin carboxyl-terminal hydrolase 37 isoform X1 [Peromyscus maniculatus bairdii]XP_042116035.1 ubiquitin carboxyl-terminal hydrolase 37 isoform X1 [Peromyscus maniculatus bairdii]XP_042116036.1 ubiquitin carboxyl-terminal hydrolase 37 isoform X1 [Peromyscus maniculatus bairdii]XP_042116037.1 